MSNSNDMILRAPLSGVVYPLERVPDHPVFAQKLMGDGLSIDPTDNILRAPHSARKTWQTRGSRQCRRLRLASCRELAQHAFDCSSVEEVRALQPEYGD